MLDFGLPTDPHSLTTPIGKKPFQQTARHKSPQMTTLGRFTVKIDEANSKGLHLVSPDGTLTEAQLESIRFTVEFEEGTQEFSEGQDPFKSGS